jgi:drug/metabolite transporter (DMT)-like permease
MALARRRHRASGALILIRPGAAMEAGALLALGAALFIGLELIFIKRLSGREPPLQILLISNSIGVLIAERVAVIWVWQAPTPPNGPGWPRWASPWPPRNSASSIPWPAPTRVS